MTWTLPGSEPIDENAHPCGPELLWNESWYFDFVQPDGQLGGYVRVGRYPNLGVVWYWACVVGPDQPLVTVIDHGIPLGRGGALEVRHEGLWADHHIEEPLQRWSLSLESFAVELDDPRDVYHGAAGHRLPFGFDLEWETDGAVFGYPVGLTRYEIPCRVHGELLIDRDRRVEVDGFGQRDHSWGVRDWWMLGHCWTAFRLLDTGERFHAVTTKPEGLYAMGYRQTESEGLETVHSFVTGETLDGEGLAEPTISFELGLGEGGAADLGAGTEDAPRRFEVEPLAWSPVLMVGPEGQQARLARALARFTDRDRGARGLGWLEYGQPDG